MYISSKTKEEKEEPKWVTDVSLVIDKAVDETIALFKERGPNLTLKEKGSIMRRSLEATLLLTSNARKEAGLRGCCLKNNVLDTYTIARRAKI